MYVEISPGDVDHTHRIGLLSKGEVVKFVRYMDRRQVFTKKKKLKGKNMSITNSYK